MDRPGIGGGSTCLGRARSPSSPTAAPRPGAGDRAQEAGDQELPDVSPITNPSSQLRRSSCPQSGPAHHITAGSGQGGVGVKDPEQRLALVGLGAGHREADRQPVQGAQHRENRQRAGGGRPAALQIVVCDAQITALPAQ